MLLAVLEGVQCPTEQHRSVVQEVSAVSTDLCRWFDVLTQIW